MMVTNACRKRVKMSRMAGMVSNLTSSRIQGTCGIRLPPDENFPLPDTQKAEFLPERYRSRQHKLLKNLRNTTCSVRRRNQTRRWRDRRRTYATRSNRGGIPMFTKMFDELTKQVATVTSRR